MKFFLVTILAAMSSVSAYAVEPGPCAALTKRHGYYKFINKTCDSFTDGEMGVVPYETNAPEGYGSVIMAAGVSMLIPHSLTSSYRCEESEGKLVVTACNGPECSSPAVFTFLEKDVKLTAGDCEANYTKDRDYTP